MIWVSLESFCKITKISRQAVAKKVDGGLLKSKKEHGRLFLGLEIEPDDISELLDQQKEVMDDQLEKSKNMLMSLSENTKKQYEQMLTEIKGSHNQIIKAKDDQIELLTKLLERKEKGFLKRLFGG